MGALDDCHCDWLMYLSHQSFVCGAGSFTDILFGGLDTFKKNEGARLSPFVLDFLDKTLEPSCLFNY